MQIVPAKTPEFVKTLFPSFVWNIDTNYKELYLTFDDGPTPEITDWVLNVLEQYNAKATFFCIGKNIEKYPEIFHRIISNNHSIGNHTYNHLKGWKHKTKDYVQDVERAKDIIDDHLKRYTNRESKNEAVKLFNSKLFRPPYGKFKSKQNKQLQMLNYKIILWDVLSYDWDNSVSKQACLKNVESVAKEGSIIVFHDSIKASRNLMHVLPIVLASFSQKGYEFKAITEY